MTIEEYREIRKRDHYYTSAQTELARAQTAIDRRALLSLVDELAVGWMDDRYDGKLPPEERQRRVRIAEAIVAEGTDV